MHPVPDTGAEMPKSTKDWQFVCWTNRPETAVFLHRAPDCRDALASKLDEALGVLTAIASQYRCPNEIPRCMAPLCLAVE